MAKTGTKQQLSDSASESDTTSVETLSTKESPISALIQPSIPDPVCELYNDSNHGFVLARTFRSGDLNGIDRELAYLQNFPGIIVANPTTVIVIFIRRLH